MSDPQNRSEIASEKLEWMRREWDLRARTNARYFIATTQADWTDDEFFASGRACIDQQISTDMVNICADRDPRDMRVLEIGCGTGRLTHALASVFGEVHGVDVSGEMIVRARQSIAERGIRNAHVYQNNGQDLSVVPNFPFHFAFSWIVFQHIPLKAVIESYIRETHRLLVPGSLFKFQAQGYPLKNADHDTWLGVSFTAEEMGEIAARCGFDRRYYHGEGTQDFINWMFRL